MNDEVWRGIKDYPGYYVSSHGRVKSTKQGGRILRPAIDSYGYLIVRLCNEVGKKTRTIHRLVAEAFVQNPSNKPEVDHINTIRTDNRAENLRWVTSKENANNPISIAHYKAMPHIYEAVKKTMHSLVQLKDNIIIAEYKSIREAERVTGVGHQNICGVLKGRCKTAGGYGWRRKE